MTMQQIAHNLIDRGGAEYDVAMKNLDWQVSLTDAQFYALPPDDIFGPWTDAEEFRDYARRTQDRLIRRGRDAFAADWAENQRMNTCV